MVGRGEFEGMEGVVNKFGRTVARHQTQRGKVECQIKFSFYRGRKIVTRELNVSNVGRKMNVNELFAESER